MNLCIYSIADFCTLYLYTNPVNIKSHLVLFLYNVCIAYKLDDGRIIGNPS